MTRRTSDEAGLSLPTVIVFSVLCGAVVYVAYHVLPFYYYYYELRGHFEQIIKVASVETDEEIRKRLMYHIKKYGIPCEPEDLRIERSNDTMTISLRYQEVFYIPWQGKDYEVKRFDFDATVTGQYR